jgi:hypothetical protein
MDIISSTSSPSPSSVSKLREPKWCGNRSKAVFLALGVKGLHMWGALLPREGVVGGREDMMIA